MLPPGKLISAATASAAAISGGVEIDDDEAQAERHMQRLIGSFQSVSLATDVNAAASSAAHPVAGQFNVPHQSSVPAAQMNAGPKSAGRKSAVHARQSVGQRQVQAAAAAVAAEAAAAAEVNRRLHVDNWSNEQRQRRADADAQEMHDAGVRTSQLQPWLQLLFSGGAPPLPVMPTVLVDLIASMALPLDDAQAPIVASMYTVVRSRADSRAYNYLLEINDFDSAGEVCVFLCGKLREDESDDDEDHEANGMALDDANWQPLLDKLNEEFRRRPDSCQTTLTEVRVRHVRA